jgi:uncharacterized phage-like protein YoqJ
MIIAFTGHRKLTHPQIKIAKQLMRFLTAFEPKCTISGMALGFDQLAARVCVSMGIPFVAAVPFKGQESKWPVKAQRHYFKILERAHKVVYIDKLKGYKSTNFVQKFHNRNHWMVDKSDKVIAYYRNKRRGGTAECIRYAHSKFKMVVPLEIR